MLRLKGVAIRAISLDCQGTLYHHRRPIENVYASLAVPLLPDPPSEAEFKSAFRDSYADTLKSYPHYRFPNPDPGAYSTRRWWRELCRHTLELTGREYSDELIDRFFRAVYQHYGSTLGYSAYPDATELIAALASFNAAAAPAAPGVLVGVTANVSSRTIDTTLPSLACMHAHMHFFATSQEAGCAKPALGLYAHTFAALQRWAPGLQKSQVLHVGSSAKLDYAAAREFGFQALLLDREGTGGGGGGGSGEDLHLQHHLEASTGRGQQHELPRIVDAKQIAATQQAVYQDLAGVLCESPHQAEKEHVELLKEAACAVAVEEQPQQEERRGEGHASEHARDAEEHAAVPHAGQRRGLHEVVAQCQ